MEAVEIDKKIENLSEFQIVLLLLAAMAHDGVDIVKRFGSQESIKTEI